MSFRVPCRSLPIEAKAPLNGRGRDEDCSPPPAQIPACAANAPGSSLGSNVGRHAVIPRALRRTAANRIDVATRLSVRTTAACRLFPSGEVLRQHRAPPSWPAPRSNPHSARCLVGAKLPATSCLGAFRTPAARVRGASRHCRRPKTCTGADFARLPASLESL